VHCVIEFSAMKAAKSMPLNSMPRKVQSLPHTIVTSARIPLAIIFVRSIRYLRLRPTDEPLNSVPLNTMSTKVQ
jgi:hypothetical protein